MRSWAAITLATLLLASAGTATAGVIHGHLLPGRETGPSKGIHWGITDAVIYIEEIPEVVERKLTHRGFWIFGSSQPRLWRIVLQQRRFDPQVLAAAVGDRLGISNFDHVYHHAFSVSAARSFDLGKRLPGQSDTLTLNRPGVVNLHCEIHPDMAGYVVVTPNHAFALPGADGLFHLPSLPAGTYAVRVFHPRWGQIRRSVEVPRHGDVELNLKF
jgi:hypothetical protein